MTPREAAPDPDGRSPDLLDDALPRGAEGSARRRFIAASALVAAVVVAADLLTKAMVMAELPLYTVREVVPSLLVFTHIRNTGAAFGMLAGQTWLVPLQLAIAVLVPVILWRTGTWHGRPLLGGCASGLILGGALGNLIDRLQHGSVTDFIQVVPVPLFQVFNLADAAICTGVAVLLLLSLLQSTETRPARAEG